MLFSLMSESSKKLTLLRDFTLWSIFLVFEMGASIRAGVFIREGV